MPNLSLSLCPRTSEDTKNHVLVKRDHGAGGGGHHHQHDNSHHGDHQTDHGLHSNSLGDHGSHHHTAHGSSSHQHADQLGYDGGGDRDSSQHHQHHDHSHSSSSSSSYGGEEDRLDQQIRFLINDIQNRIEIAKTTIEDSIAFTNLKKTTQGWAIIVGSWKDILSDWVGQDFSQDQAGTFGEFFLSFESDPILF